MSMWPFDRRNFWPHWWDYSEMDRPSRIFDQHFGGALEHPFHPQHSRIEGGPPPSPRAEERGAGMGMGMVPYWMRLPVSREQGRETGGMSEVVSDKEKFQVNLDVTHFAPEEIKVKTVDNHLIVEGKHEERQDEHGYVARHFTRKYHLPHSVDPTTVISSLSHQGVLCIQAPKKKEEGTQERPVAVKMTPEEKK